MNNYIHNLITRHAEPGRNVKPLVRTLFEPANTAAPLQTDSLFDPAATSGAAQPFFENKNPFDESPGAETKDGPGIFVNKNQDRDSPKTATFFQNQQSGTTTGNNNKNKIAKENVSVLQPESAFRFNTKNAAFTSDAKDFTPISGFEKPFTGDAQIKGSDATKAGSRAGKHDLYNPEIVVEPAIKPAQKQQSAGTYSFAKQPAGALQAASLVSNIKPAQGQNAYPSRPVIKVTIGRVDVRAIVQATAPPKTNGHAKPQMSLDDYLKKRNNPAS